MSKGTRGLLRVVGSFFILISGSQVYTYVKTLNCLDFCSLLYALLSLFLKMQQGFNKFKNFLLYLKSIETETERAYWFRPQMPAIPKARTGQSQEPENQSSSRTWVAGTTSGTITASHGAH